MADNAEHGPAGGGMVPSDSGQDPGPGQPATGVEPAPVEEEPKAEVKRGRKKKKNLKDTLAALVPESTAEYTLAEGEVLELRYLRVDTEGKQGQIRNLNPADVERVYENLVLNPPVTLQTAVVWQAAEDRMPLVVLPPLSRVGMHAFV